MISWIGLLLLGVYVLLMFAVLVMLLLFAQDARERARPPSNVPGPPGQRAVAPRPEPAGRSVAPDPESDRRPCWVCTATGRKPDGSQCPSCTGTGTLPPVPPCVNPNCSTCNPASGQIPELPVPIVKKPVYVKLGGPYYGAYQCRHCGHRNRGFDNTHARGCPNGWL